MRSIQNLVSAECGFFLLPRLSRTLPPPPPPPSPPLFFPSRAVKASHPWTRSLTSLLISKPSSEMSINGFCCCLHIRSVASLCRRWRIRKGTPMNNLRQAGICKRVNRHKKQNAGNCSSLHELIALLSPVFSSLELSVPADPGSARRGDFCGRMSEWADGGSADVGAELHYNFTHWFAQVLCNCVYLAKEQHMLLFCLKLSNFVSTIAAILNLHLTPQKVCNC